MKVFRVSWTVGLEVRKGVGFLEDINVGEGVCDTLGRGIVKTQRDWNQAE